MKRYPPLVSLLSPSFVSFSTAAAITITRFTISPPSPVLVSATLRFSNSRRTLEILSRRRRSIGRKEPEIVTQMNLKYCHFTFPPVPLSPSLPSTTFFLQFSIILPFVSPSLVHHLLHKRSPPPNLSLKPNTHPLPCTVICFSFPFFLSNPLSSPLLPTKPGVSPSRPFLFRSRPSFHPPPKRFPNVFLARFRRLVQVRHPSTLSLHTLVSLALPHDRCTWPHLQVQRLNGIGGDDKSNGNRKSQ